MEWWQTLLGFIGTGIITGVGSIFVANRWAKSAETAAAALVERTRVDRWDKFSTALETRLTRTEVRLDDCEEQHAECEKRHQNVIREFEEIKGAVKQMTNGGVQ